MSKAEVQCSCGRIFPVEQPVSSWPPLKCLVCSAAKEVRELGGQLWSGYGCSHVEHPPRFQELYDALGRYLVAVEENPPSSIRDP